MGGGTIGQYIPVGRFYAGIPKYHSFQVFCRFCMRLVGAGTGGLLVSGKRGGWG